MKGLIILLCALVAVQARSGAISRRVGTEAAKGENPWLVHLRTAVSTSGLLQTYAGSLISESWVLTSATSLTDVRFIWVRYGAINVINPELVTENSAVRLNNALGLISINRVVQTTANIAPVALAPAGADLPESATFCSYNIPESEVPGEILVCSEEALNDVEGEESSFIGLNSAVSRFDLGAPLVKDSVQIGVLVDAAGVFVRTGDYLEWIEAETGVDFSSRVPAVIGEDDGLKVNIVN